MKPDVLRSMTANMVARLGGGDAAVALLESAGFRTTTSSVSRMLSGEYNISAALIFASERALGEYPVTRLHMEGGGEAGTRAVVRSLHALGAAVAARGGTAAGDIISAVSPDGPGGAAITQQERAETIASLRELIDAAQSAVDALERAE